MMLEIQEQYLTDTEGNKIAVVINIETYHKLIEELDEFYCLKGYEQAVAETESEIVNDEYLTLNELFKI